jgi:hypothetical protein
MNQTGEAVNKQSYTNNPVIEFKKKTEPTYDKKHKQNTKKKKYRI